MIHTIAICDDDPIINNYIKGQVAEYFNQLKVTYSIDTFFGGNELLHKINITEYQLIFLDIDMPDINGLTVSEKLRKKNIESEIVYVSSHSDYVFTSIQYTPLRFIRKEFISKELPEALNAYINNYQKKNAFVTFHTTNGDITVSLSSINFVESYYKHSLIIHTDKLEISIRGSLTKYEKDWSTHGFIRIHNSYLVNYRYIYSINAKTITTITKDDYPVSRGKISEIKDLYMKCITANK